MGSCNATRTTRWSTTVTAQVSRQGLQKSGTLIRQATGYSACCVLSDFIIKPIPGSDTDSSCLRHVDAQSTHVTAQPRRVLRKSGTPISKMTGEGQGEEGGGGENWEAWGRGRFCLISLTGSYPLLLSYTRGCSQHGLWQYPTTQSKRSSPEVWNPDPLNDVGSSVRLRGGGGLRAGAGVGVGVLLDFSYRQLHTPPM